MHRLPSATNQELVSAPYTYQGNALHPLHFPTPPHTYPHLPTRLQDTVSALDTCQAALQALHACTRSLETDLQLLEEAGGKAAGAVK